MADKRCYNTGEAMQYLGIKRKAFETYILPNLQGFRIGTSVVFERADLDAAWESYKIAAGSERPAVSEGDKKWDVPKLPASRSRRPATTSTRSTKVSDFASVASSILSQRKAG